MVIFNPWHYLTDTDLPPSMKRWVELIGIESVRAILEQCHGQRKYIPKKVNPVCKNRSGDHWLVAIVGEEKAATCSKHYGGLFVLFPFCTLSIRRYEVVQRQLQGLSLTKIARDKGLSGDGVRKILKRVRQGGGYACEIEGKVASA